jgi:hypothetical protein
MLWAQADWLSTPTALTNFMATQEWEAGSLLTQPASLGIVGVDSLLLALTQTTLALYLPNAASGNVPTLAAATLAFAADVLASWPQTSLRGLTALPGLENLDETALGLAYSLAFADTYVCS